MSSYQKSRFRFSSVGSCHSPNIVTENSETLFASTNKNEQPEYKQAENLLDYTIDKLKSVKPEHSKMDRLLQDISFGLFKKAPRREAYRLAFDNAIENLGNLKFELGQKDNSITAKQIEDTVVSNLNQCLDMLNVHKSTETLREFLHYFPTGFVFDDRIYLPFLKQYQNEEQEKSSHTYVSLRDMSINPSATSLEL